MILCNWRGGAEAIRDPKQHPHQHPAEHFNIHAHIVLEVALGLGHQFLHHGLILSNQNVHDVANVCRPLKSGRH